jgi:transcriptional/translational regulatory protein YebC/TACO1
MGEQGSVSWMFERKSQILVPAEKTGEDDLMGVVLDAGGDDLRREGDHWAVISPPEAHESVLKALEAAKIAHEEASIAYVPKNLIRLEGKNAAGILKLTEALEEHDDVQNVYSNFDIDEKELEALAQ